MDAPRWLNDEPALQALLHAVLDRFDRQSGERRQRDVLLSATGAVPAMQRGDAQADQLWSCIEDLKQLGVLNIRRVGSSQRDPYAAPWEGAKLAFAPAIELLLRDWLSRPRSMTTYQAWREAVQQQAGFVEHAAWLQERPIVMAGRSAPEVATALAEANDLSGTFTLRQLSARLFWGDSKVFDERGELVARLFPHLTLRERAIVVSVWLPANYRDVLFIENQDTYVACCQSASAESGQALVYAAGFRATATRIRTPEGAQLHFGGPGLSQWLAFSEWWFAQRPVSGQLFFWGDLDFAGMQILKSLRERFGEVRAWQSGYAPMLEVLGARGGHGRDAVQLDPGGTGCEYADQVLLPAIRHQGLMDQECITTLQTGHPIAD